MTITTLEAGRDYRVNVNGQSVRLMLNEDNYVMGYTADASLGGWKLERFGGQLTRESILNFFGGK